MPANTVPHIPAVVHAAKGRNWGQIPIKENISIQPLEYVQLKLLFLNHECSIGW